MAPLMLPQLPGCSSLDYRVFKSASLELLEDLRSWSLAYKKQRRGAPVQESHRVLVYLTTMLSLLLLLKTNRRGKNVTSKGALILFYIYSCIFLYSLLCMDLFYSGFLLFLYKYSL